MQEYHKITQRWESLKSINLKSSALSRLNTGIDSDSARLPVLMELNNNFVKTSPSCEIEQKHEVEKVNYNSLAHELKFIWCAYAT